MSHARSAIGGDPYARMRQLGIVLPKPPTPIANFLTFVREGNLLFLSGQGPLDRDGRLHSGKVGADVTAEDAYRPPV